MQITEPHATNMKLSLELFVIFYLFNIKRQADCEPWDDLPYLAIPNHLTRLFGLACFKMLR